MRRIRLIFILVFILSFSALARAQDVPDYLFLEVLDSNKNPVADAEVKSGHAFGSSFEVGEKRELKTDEKGTVGFYLDGYYYFPSRSLFSVSKDGYFTFNDLGLSKPHHRVYRATAQVELLKIPQTDEEKRILGSEQINREFMWAAKTGDEATIKKLLKIGVSPHLKTTDLRGVPGLKDVSAIDLAVNSADAETVETLIKAGVNIRANEDLRRRVLIEYLLADPFFWHKFKSEAEQREILRRYENGVAILLKAGADFNAVGDSNKRTPVMIAAEKGYARALEMLLAKGISPDLADERGVTLLMYAVGETYPPVKYSKAEAVKLLLKKGAKLNLSKNGCEFSVLGGAARRGDVETIQVLLKAGARVDAGCASLPSPLIEAVEYGQIEAAKILIEAGADKTAVNRDGENALMMAAKRGNAEMVKMLLDKNFPVNAKTESGWTALLLSFEYYSSANPEVVKLLLQAGADPNAVLENKANGICLMPLKSATERHNFDFVKLLIEHGANINLACSTGETALVYAVSRRNVSAVRQLIALGADVKSEPVESALNSIKKLFKGNDYERKYVDETIKIVEEARAGKKP